MTAPRVASVFFNRPLPEAYDYLIPAASGEFEPGMLVRAPLGQKEEIGIVAKVGELHGQESRSLKPLIARAAPDYRVNQEIHSLANWMSDYYFCAPGEALACVSMVGFSDEQLRVRTVYSLNPSFEPEALTPRQRTAFEQLLKAPPDQESDSLAAIARIAGCSSAVAKALLEAGALQAQDTYDFPAEPLPSPDEPPELLEEQRVAFHAVEETRKAGRFGVFLLHGVTGSGKTEVYLRLIQEALNDGKSAMCLVPEISLTPQTVARFTRRFQREIGVFHSQMSRGEKLRLSRKIERGEIRIVIGARSAVFAPFPDLGLIVIDEEHETSYKQGETPRYHARDLAVYRSSRLKIPILLGSATPSMESYENARKGKYTLLTLKSRPAGLEMPKVSIVPMGQAAANDSELVTLISKDLELAIRQRIEKGEQSLLFLNRRGFSNFLLCPNCRWVARCDEDDIVMTIHRKGGRKKNEEREQELELELFPKPLPADEAFLKCHFCGKTASYPRVCPECNEGEPIAVGAGTQRMEEALRRIFPEAFILRLDQDSTGGRKGFLKAWQQMVSGEAQIILGTQMIAKGLHLEGVTLVGVLLADVGLFLPDPRAEERTFCLLTQVAGRAGRTNAGEVLFQTYMPHHSAIQLAARHDYERFFSTELERREKLRFPPVQRLIALTISDKEAERARRWARTMGNLLRQEARDTRGGPMIIGPRAAPLARLAGRFRERILIRGPHYKANAGVLRAALGRQEWRPPAAIRLAIDVDPLDLL